MTSLDLRIWPDMLQRSEAWFNARAGRPTASQFGRIITAAGKTSTAQKDYALELIAESLATEEIEASFYGNMHTDRGNKLEPDALRYFESYMNLEVTEAGFVTRDDGLVGCSPDGLIKINGEWRAGVEAKCPQAKKHAKTVLDNILPNDHKIQVHGSMAVTGLDYWYFISYHKKLKPFILRVERDEFTEKVAVELDKFVIYYSEMRQTLIPKLRRGGK